MSRRIIPFLFLPLSIFGQNASTHLFDLMHNKNITWVAEYYNDFIVNPMTENVVGKNINKVKILKILSETENEIDEEFLLQEFVLEAAQKGLLTLYEDDNCLEKTTFDSVYFKHYDRVSTAMSEPIVYESISCTFGRENKINASNISFFRAHQIIFYDSLNAQFGLKTIAIAPVRVFYDKKDKVHSWYPLFWMKASDLNVKKDLSDKNVCWAGQLRKNMPFKADSVTTLKQANIDEPRKSFFDAVRFKSCIPFYHHYARTLDKRETVIMPDERKNLFYEEIEVNSQINANEKVTKLVYNPHIMDGIKGLRIVQNWYWDDEKKCFDVWHSATSMLYYEYDEVGNLMGSQGVFYRRTDD